MNIELFVTDYLLVESELDRSSILSTNDASLTTPTIADEAIAEMKARADQLQRADSARAQVAVDAMMQFANYTDDPLHLALAYFAKGNLEWVAFGRFAEALELLDLAAGIYEREQQELPLAKLAISKIAVLANLGRFEDALAVGEQSQQVLLSNQEMETYARLTDNMARVCKLTGNLPHAQTLFEEAEGILKPLDKRYHYGQLLINKSILLRTTGNLTGAIKAAQQAYEILDAEHHISEAYRARQSIAVTYMLIGRYNEALDILNTVQSFYEADKRGRDALRVGLYICETLLHIHQYPEVIAKCGLLRATAAQRQTEREASLAALMEARAYIALEKYMQAEKSLAFAHAIFTKQGNQFAVARMQLQMALIDYRRGDYAKAYVTATNCTQTFGKLSADYDELSANLLIARILLAQEAIDAARQQIAQSLTAADTIDAPIFSCHTYELQGDLALLEKNQPAAMNEYKQSIDALETLKGNLMVEHRVEFAAENQHVYEKAVETALALDDFTLALEYAERAKSRSLLELLAYQIDLGIEAKSEDDVELVAELKRLQAERNRIYRDLEGSDELRFTTMSQSDQGWGGYHEILSCETKITDLWQRLLVRNRAYSQDAALLWQWQKEPIHEHIEPDTLVVEYFVVGDRLVLFLIDSKNVMARYLTASLTEVNQLLSFFDLNCASVVDSQYDKRLSALLLEQSQAILHELYQQLLAPIATEIAEYKKLLIVPHYSLHHLPFHALYTGSQYLIETHIVHYLPSASLLRFCGPRPAANGVATSGIDQLSALKPTCTTFGYSNNNRLPHSVTEAEQIAELMQGVAYINEEATAAALRTNGATAHVLHISTHGDFHEENPLFSGLTLADGQLTILDIFDLRIQASLVVLSACQTGRNVVSNGDELRGLLRAFLYAGASSLVLTHWPIEDRSTAHFMNGFYNQLTQGSAKNCALRAAQLAFIHNENISNDSIYIPQTHSLPKEPSEDVNNGSMTSRNITNSNQDYRHPYWWASFFLVGHAGKL